MADYDTALAEIRAELAELAKITSESADTQMRMADTLDAILAALKQCRQAATGGGE